MRKSLAAALLAATALQPALSLAASVSPSGLPAASSVNSTDVLPADQGTCPGTPGTGCTTRGVTAAQIKTYVAASGFAQVQLTPTTVASLPGSPSDGEVAYATDITSCETSSIAGGGSIHSVVYYNGSAGHWQCDRTFSSHAANTFLAAPNGSSGTPTFRAIVGADLPTVGPGGGGTGLTNPTAHDLLAAEGSSNFALIAPSSASGEVLTSNGASADPTFQVPGAGFFMVRWPAVAINATGDTAATVPAWAAKYWHAGTNSLGDMITNCSGGSVNTADVFQVFTGTGGTGTAVTNAWSSTNLGQLTSSSGIAQAAIPGADATTTFTASTLYFHISTADANAITCDVELIFKYIP